MESKLDEYMDEFIKIQNETDECKRECKTESKEDCTSESEEEYRSETESKEDSKSETKEECKTGKQTLNNVFDNVINRIMKGDSTGVDDLLNAVSKDMDSFDIPLSTKNHLSKAFKIADSILKNKKDGESKDDLFKNFLNIVNNVGRDSDLENSSVKSEESDTVIRITNNQTTEGTENIDTAHHYSTGDIPKETENNVTSDIDNKLSLYKSLLRMCFTLSENIIEKKGIKEIRGFAEQQNLEMIKYEDILRELAEKNLEPPEPSYIPVEIRLILIVMLNTFLYIMTKRLENSLTTPEEKPLDRFKFNISPFPTTFPTICRIPNTPIRCNKKNLNNFTTYNKPKKETTTTVVTTTKNGVTKTVTTSKTIKY